MDWNITVSIHHCESGEDTFFYNSSLKAVHVFVWYTFANIRINVPIKGYIWVLIIMTGLSGHLLKISSRAKTNAFSELFIILSIPNNLIKTKQNTKKSMLGRFSFLQETLSGIVCRRCETGLYLVCTCIYNYYCYEKVFYLELSLLLMHRKVLMILLKIVIFEIWKW